MSERRGAINEYVCEKCGLPTRTINRDAGTTPFLIRCRNVACGEGMAQSQFYRVSQAERPRWEWFQPSPEEFEEWVKEHREEEHRAELQEHVARGGMLLRKLDQCRLEEYGIFRVRRG